MARKASRKTQKKKCDTLWSWCVRNAAQNRCALCGEGPVQAHHLIRRDAIWYRHDPSNGIALCFRHHTGSNVDSAHGAPLGFMALLHCKLPVVLGWWQDNRHTLHIGQKIDYEEVYKTLQEWEREIKAGDCND